jgi:hypothetical protein
MKFNPQNTKETIKDFFYDSALLKGLVYPIKVLHDFYYFNKIKDKSYLREKYFNVFKVKLNISDPKTLNEKIQWLKLYDRTSLHTLCADKYTVREYIKNTIGAEYLIPLLSHSTDSKYIRPENLPNPPYVIKTNHDSGNVFIVKDVKKHDWVSIRNQLKYSLRYNYYHSSREWQYKNIEPKILIEKMLTDENGQILNDIKFCCLHGKVEIIHIDSNKEVVHLRSNYSRDWEPLDLSWPNDLKRGPITNKPKNLKKLIELAEQLSQPFKFVRIDFYVDKDKIYFGEITFHPTSGFGPMIPNDYDFQLGEKLNLSSVKDRTL